MNHFANEKWAWALVRLIFVFCLFACIRNEEPEKDDSMTSADPTAKSEETERPTIAVEQSEKVKIGFIERLAPRVSVRRKRELLWQEAAKGCPLFGFDAVHTQENATARLLLDNGSQLDMKPNTLVILNPAALNSPARKDRAIVRNGQLIGRTRSELWILTSGALLKIKPKTKAGIAQASLNLNEGKKLQVTLTDGEGVLFRQKETGGRYTEDRITLKPNKIISLAAPKAAQDFGREMTPTNWEAGPAVAEKLTEIETTEPVEPSPKKPEKALKRAPSSQPPQRKEVSMTMLSPKSYSEVDSQSVVVHGKLSGIPKSLKINGQTVQPDATLEFNLIVPLKLGANPILIELTNEGKEPVNQRLIVNRKR